MPSCSAFRTRVRCRITVGTCASLWTDQGSGACALALVEVLHDIVLEPHDGAHLQALVHYPGGHLRPHDCRSNIVCSSGATDLQAAKVQAVTQRQGSCSAALHPALLCKCMPILQQPRASSGGIACKHPPVLIRVGQLRNRGCFMMSNAFWRLEIHDSFRGVRERHLRGDQRAHPLRAVADCQAVPWRLARVWLLHQLDACSANDKYMKCLSMMLFSLCWRSSCTGTCLRCGREGAAQRFSRG